ncbi:MAG: ATP-binding protein [Paludibacteraceae bacterium]|nr:ATP-binding protein [Paludibacteraceae bacterium]
MLERKFATYLKEFLTSTPNKVMLVDGARQIGKSYIIRYVGTSMFKHFIEIDLRTDSEGERIFQNVRTTNDFYIQLGILAGDKLGDVSNTMIFLDEIQVYPHLLTMLKFLNQEHRYRYIASGSQLGIALSQSTSVPLGSIETQHMYPLDFEEFLWAMNVGKDAIESFQQSYIRKESLQETTHNYILKLFRYYLLTGGLPEAVNTFVSSRNIKRMRQVQHSIYELYKIDASQYDKQNSLKIRRIYDLIPSNLENKKKRVVFKNIENKRGKQFRDYEDEFEYLIQSAVTLDASAISNPRFPLIESVSKNLIKLYLNDVGLLTHILYNNNENAVLNDQRSINLGTVYESVVAQELKAHGFKLHYYDNKQNGEIDFLINDYDSLSVLPIEVKSGKDYYIHSALHRLMANNEYNIKKAIVFSNTREISQKGNIVYMPIYYIMFLSNL